MPTPGYCQDPTLWEELIVFVGADGLWSCSLQEGSARPLLLSRGSIRRPVLSPDGRWIAFSEKINDHDEVHVVPLHEGTHIAGPAQQLTFFGEDALVIGWDHAGAILFSAGHESPFQQHHVYRILPGGTRVEHLPIGPANFLSYGPELSTGAQPLVLQRHGAGYHAWKRYRGGTIGQIWIDSQGDGTFQKLLNLKSNTLRPLWVQGRIYFLSDHEGHGNLYSCTPQGQDLKRHTHHQGFYARNSTTDGKRIVYTCQGDIWVFDPTINQTSKVPLQYYAPAPQKALKNPSSYLTSYTLSPNGQNLGLTTRGRLFRLFCFQGPTAQQGDTDGVRYRLTCWLPRGDKLLAVKDQGRDEVLEVHDADPLTPPTIIPDLGWGRILKLKSAPGDSKILLANHKNQLLLVDLNAKTCTPLAQDPFAPLEHFDWSPDGAWVVYSLHVSRKISTLYLCEIATLKTTPLTRPLARDFAPCFDQSGQYIFFLSARTFEAVWDPLIFHLGFEEGVKPYLITLQANTRSPFLPPLGQETEDDDEKEESEAPAPPTLIELEGITDRILEFPLQPGCYRHIESIKDKALYRIEEETETASGKLETFDFLTLKAETLVTAVQHFELSADRRWIAYNSGQQLRVIKADEKPEEQDTSYKAGGWIDWSRIPLLVNPAQEWVHMFDESWRLQKELFWREDMGDVDWDEVYARYRPVIDRISTTTQLHDLIQEMQGELGTSHAYILKTHTLESTQGQLGARMMWDGQAWRITHIDRGDLWHTPCASPLLQPGMNLQIGDRVWAIAGQKLSADTPPEKFLMHQGGNTVPVVVSQATEDNKRTLWVKPLKGSSVHLRYRDWVVKNRSYVHEKTQGRIGYIHIPDMEAKGFQEFYRSYSLELNREGLIIDVRFNSGGRISSMILEKLVLKRLGLDQTRWHGHIPYPEEAPPEPMVTLCNEYTGSDGDMFCHSVKKLGLGPLIGKRTWGGVIGMWPRHPLIDGTVTSQPEYAFWCHDIGWSLENEGVSPDLEVELAPGETIDTQLDQGIEKVLDILKNHPCKKPQPFKGSCPFNKDEEKKP